MRLLELLGFRDSGDSLTVTTSNEAAGAGSYLVEFRMPTIAEDYARRSNDAAEMAMQYGVLGYWMTAYLAAELADAYALMAATARWAEEQKDYLRKAS